MKKITDPYHLVRESKVLNLSTQTTSSILLNGSMKSSARYDLRGYLDFSSDDSIEYITLALPYAVIPNSNLIVAANNNRLYYTIGSTSDYIEIPHGNYTASQMKTYLNTTFTAEGLVCAIDTITNSYTFTCPSYFQFWANSTCDYILGFSGLQESTELVSGDFFLQLPRSFNYLPIPRFVVHCSLLNDGILLGPNSTMGSCDILATIPNASKPSAQLVYESAGSEFMLKSFDLDQFTITITDDNNRPSDFRGISSYFQLRFSIFRRSISRPLRFNELMADANKMMEPLDLGET